jgi:hypothetical protein
LKVLPFEKKNTKRLFGLFDADDGNLLYIPIKLRNCMKLGLRHIERRIRIRTFENHSEIVRGLRYHETMTAERRCQTVVDDDVDVSELSGLKQFSEQRSGELIVTWMSDDI